MCTCVYACVRVCAACCGKRDQVHVGTLTSFWGCLSVRFRAMLLPVRVCVCERVFVYVFVRSEFNNIYRMCLSGNRVARSPSG